MDALTTKAACLNSLMRSSEAIEVLEQALRIDPRHDFALVNFGYTLHSMGRSEEALSFFEKAIQYNPDITRGYQGRACILEESGKYKEALSDLEKAFLLYPNDGLILASKAEVLYALDRVKESEKTAAQATKISLIFLGHGKPMGISFIITGNSGMLLWHMKDHVPFLREILVHSMDLHFLI